MEHYEIFATDGVSSCCGAKVICPDFCSDCKEHCSIDMQEDHDAHVAPMDGCEFCKEKLNEPSIDYSTL